MSLVPEQSAFLEDVARLIPFVISQGFQLSGGEVWRSPEQQAVYVKTGRSKTMDSNHLRRLAIDLNFFKAGKLVQTKEELTAIGAYWESLNPKNLWGGNFNSFVDIPHFERNV